MHVALVRTIILVCYLMFSWGTSSLWGASSDEAVAALKQDLMDAQSDLHTLVKRDYANTQLTKADAAVTRQLLWDHYVLRMKKDRAAEIETLTLQDGELKMPLFVKKFGEKPAGGHSLWISLHGGGGAPPQVNDGQWENQKRLYRLEEGIYVAPRAPTNTWNLWHEAHIDRLFDRLIADMIVLEQIDPDRVYVLGYSAGGDGVYQLAPRMADRWAAAAMMAGHPNDAQPLSLRNVPFALQVGALDRAFNRNEVVKQWGEKLDQLQKEDPQGYPHLVKIHAGKGHWMDGDDAAVLPWMAKQRRDTRPVVVVWKQGSVPHQRSYWLAVPPDQARGGTLVSAARDGQSITIRKSEGVDKLLIRLDDRMLDMDQPVRILREEQELVRGSVSRTIATQIATLLERGDPQLVFDGEMSVDLAE